MIDAHDAQLEPLDQQLRDYARRQAGCRHQARLVAENLHR
jgi:hypothetical protein